MKRSFRSQSGQATTEMVFMLLGFVILLLGLLFTLSLEIFNTRVLMESKYQTERSVNFENASLHSGSGREIRGWDYQDDIPFTLQDTPIYRPGGELAEGWTLLGEPTHSDSEKYTYEWVSLKGFSKGEFKADYKDRETSAVAAANLITRKGDPEGRNLTAKFPELYTALANLLGLKVSFDRLRNNPSNRVFLPANGEL